MKKRTLNLIITIIFAGIWGGFQPTIFPTETYGMLYIATAFLGGFFDWFNWKTI